MPPNDEIKTMIDCLNDVINDMEHLVEGVEKYKDTIEKYKISVDTTIKEHEEKISSLLPNTISTMGVFIVLITIVFGGFSLINIFQSMVNQTDFRLYMSILLTGQLVLNVVFLLMFLVSRLAVKRINNICNDFSPEKSVVYMIRDYYDEKFWEEMNSDIEKIKYQSLKKAFISLFEKINLKFEPDYKLDANKMHCAYCKKNKYNALSRCGPFRKAMKKYPYIFIANIIIFVMELILAISCLCAWIFSTYYFNYHIQFVISISVMVGVLFFCGIYILYYIGTRYDDENNKNDRAKKSDLKNQHRNVAIVSVILLGVSCFLLVNITFVKMNTFNWIMSLYNTFRNLL